MKHNKALDVEFQINFNAKPKNIQNTVLLLLDYFNHQSIFII